MKTIKQCGLVLSAVAALTLGACSSSGPSPRADSGTVIQDQARSEYGVVHSIEHTQETADKGGIGGSGYGLGTVAGAVIGGVAGNQVGGGSGKTIATVAGAAGGAYVGHQIEKRNRDEPGVTNFSRLTVRMQDGSYRTLSRQPDADFAVGDGVRIENDVAYRY